MTQKHTSLKFEIGINLFFFFFTHKEVYQIKLDYFYLIVNMINLSSHSKIYLLKSDTRLDVIDMLWLLQFLIYLF